jgi:phage terminase large subunit-like protein
MSAPSKYLEKIILSKKLKHGTHPVLSWCASNVSTEQDAAENLKPSKDKSTERIDCIVALIMALGRLISDGEPTTNNTIYSHGVFSLVD